MIRKTVLFPRWSRMAMLVVALLMCVPMWAERTIVLEINKTGPGNINFDYADQFGMSASFLVNRATIHTSGNYVMMRLEPNDSCSVIKTACYADDAGYDYLGNFTCEGDWWKLSLSDDFLSTRDDDGPYFIYVYIEFAPSLKGGEQDTPIVEITDNSVMALSGGNYVVKNDITFDHPLVIAGNTDLIIEEGKTMTVNATGTYGLYGLNSFDLTVRGGGKLVVNCTGEYEDEGTAIVDINNLYVLNSSCVEATGGLDGISTKKQVYLDNGTVSAIGNYGVGCRTGVNSCLYLRSGNTVYCKGKEAGIKCTELIWDADSKPGNTLIAESSDGWDIYSDEEVRLLKGQVTAITGGVGTNNGIIKIGYTKATDFIKMSKCAGTVVVKGIMSDGINFYSDTIPDASVLWGKTLRPTYKIAYNGNGGSGAMAAQPCSFVASQALTPNAFTRYGYAFTGWNTMADGSGTPYADKAEVVALTNNADETVTLYAQWASVSYIVRFDANGGKGTMGDQRINLGDSRALSANTFTHSGYAFTGWNTMADGSGTPYADKAEVVALTNNADETVTLYAQWAFASYIVRFDANGGEGTMSEQPFAKDYSQALSANSFTRDGYAFTGWNTQADGSGKKYRDEEVVRNLTSLSKYSLFAQWAKLYNVQYEVNGTIVDALTTSCTSAGIGTLPTAHELGFHNKCSVIFTIKDTGEPFTATTEVNKNLIVVAIPAVPVSIPANRKIVSFNCEFGALDFTDVTEVEAFAVGADLVAHKLTKVASNTGLILQMTATANVATEVLLPITTEYVEPLSRDYNRLIAGDDGTIYQGYVWGAKQGVEAFYKVGAEGIDVPNNRCWLDYDNTSYAKLNVNFDGEGVAAVESIENNKSILSSDTIYNLAGQKVGADYKGIVIMNGKKILKK